MRVDIAVFVFWEVFIVPGETVKALSIDADDDADPYIPIFVEHRSKGRDNSTWVIKEKVTLEGLRKIIQELTIEQLLRMHVWTSSNLGPLSDANQLIERVIIGPWKEGRRVQSVREIDEQRAF